MSYRTVYLSLLVSLLICLAGCASLGGPQPPKDASQAIGIGYVSATTAAHSIRDAMVSGAITPAQGTAMLDQVDRGLSILTTARVVYAGSTTVPPDAPKAMQLALQADALLQALIASLPKEKR